MAKHHIVPLFMLKEFIDPDCPLDREPYLWVHNSDPDVAAAKQGWRQQPPRKVTALPNYNSIQDANGVWHDKIDGPVFGNLIESPMAAILKKKIKAKLALEDRERAEVAAFISLMISRGSWFRRKYEEHLVTEAKQDILQSIGNEEERAALQKRYELQARGRVVELDDSLLSKVDLRTLRVTAPNSWHVRNTASFIREFSPIAYRMKWKFMHSQDDDVFVISDKPVAIWESEPVASPTDPFFCQFTPLTPHICLVMSWHDVPYLHVPVTTETVVEMNQVMFKQCDKLLISCKPTFPGDSVLSLP